MQCYSTYNQNARLHGKSYKTLLVKSQKQQNIIVCGDFNAALHHRKEGGEDVVGQHVFGKGRQFLETKEDRTPDNSVDNREHLIAVTRATNTVIANTFLFFRKVLKTKLLTKL